VSGNTTKDNNVSHVTKCYNMEEKKSILTYDINEGQFSLNTLQNYHLSACFKWEFFAVSDNFIISPFAISRLHNSLQLYSISQNPTHSNTHSIVIIYNQAIFDTACFTQNDSCNNLEFGRSYAG